MRERAEGELARRPAAKRRGKPRSRASAGLLAVLGLAAVFASACAARVSTPLPWQAFGTTSVGSLRGELSRLSTPEATERWTYFAAGAAEDHRSRGDTCERGYSLPEFVAYLRYTAKADQLVSEALSDFWTTHGCRRQSQKAAPPDPCNQCGSEAWESAGRLLLAVRQSEDIALLQALVREAEVHPADPIALTKGLVARARLEEMARRGVQSPLRLLSVPPPR